MKTKVRIKLLDGSSVIRYIWSDDRKTDGTVIVTEEKYPDMTCDRSYKYDQNQIMEHIQAVEPMNFHNRDHVEGFFNGHTADNRTVYTRSSDLSYIVPPHAHELGFDIFSLSINANTGDLIVNKEAECIRIEDFQQTLSDEILSEKVMEWGKYHLEVFKQISSDYTFPISQIMVKVSYLTEKVVECELLAIIEKWSNDEVCVGRNGLNNITEKFCELNKRLPEYPTLPATTSGKLPKGSILVSPLSEYILFIK